MHRKYLTSIWTFNNKKSSGRENGTCGIGGSISTVHKGQNISREVPTIQNGWPFSSSQDVRSLHTAKTYTGYPEIAHDSHVGGHFGVAKALGRLEQYFWPRKRKVVAKYIQGCDVCQRFKSGNQKFIIEP